MPDGRVRIASRRWRLSAAAAVVVLVAATTVASGVLPPPPAAAPDRALDALWNAYGDQGGHWTGGDRTASVALPDGRVVWLFSDTFLGPVNRDGTRPRSAPLIRNSVVVESYGQLGPTVTGGTPAAPQSLVGDAGSPLVYWVGDGTVESGRLRVLYDLFEPIGFGGLSVRLAGTALATFDLPDLRLVEVRRLPLSTSVAWGSSILEDGGYTYVYGSEGAGSGPQYARLARVRRGGLDGAWQFWTGRTWSDRESDSARLVTGVGTAYSVTRVGDQYVLVTVDSNIPLSRSVVAYSAPAPTGPFGPPTVLLDAPEAAIGPRPIIVYDATVHPELGRPGTLVVSYNVNSLNPDDNLADVHVYRPRFVDVRWPPPVSNPALGPPAPAGLSATVTPGGTVHIGWRSAGPGALYRLYLRDVSLGQMYFARLSTVLDRPGADLAILRNGDTYEFRVTAVAAGMEGRASAPTALAVHIFRPPPPTGLTAHPDPSGTVTLRWRAPTGAVWFTVYRRDRTAGESQLGPLAASDPTQTVMLVGPLAQDHVYDFAVSASNTAGESPVSPTVSALAHAESPPAPAQLRASASADGEVRLAWAGPPPAGLPHALEPGAAAMTYQVYQRDVTAGESTFTPWPTSSHATEAIATTLHTGDTYEFTVGEVNGAGAGPLAPPVRVSVVGGTPSAVSGLTATAGDGQVRLTWSTLPRHDVFYVVYRLDLSTGEEDYTPFPLPLLTGGLVDTNVHNGHLYLYRVGATNIHGKGPLSAAVLVQPLPRRPLAPISLQAVAGDHTVVLIWAAPGPGLSYVIDRRDASRGESFQRFSPPVTGTSFTDAMLTNGDTYEYRVSATDMAGVGPPSLVVRVVPSAAAGPRR